MNPEDRLRSAITARTSSVEPTQDGLHRIEEKLMDAQRATNRNRLLIGLGTAAAAIAAVVGVLALDDDDEKVDVVATTTTTSGPTSTTTDTTSTTEGPAPTVDPTLPVFPDPSTSRRFDDPQAVTLAFAKEMVGFRDPVIGEFAQGDSRSGEVEVRAFAQGAPTSVLVRQLDDDTWFVIGAIVESIRLDNPPGGGTISSPQTLEGAASAFEGHVVVRLFVDGVAEPIAETFVTGRGDGELGDFVGELVFDLPDGAEHGVLVLFEPSAEDGSTNAATVIRVHF
ncbi:MAG: Gmad2 immunoglobulin-like domain-containing protein [Actinomycetota bacterium]